MYRLYNYYNCGSILLSLNAYPFCAHCLVSPVLHLRPFIQRSDQNTIRVRALTLTLTLAKSL